MPLPPETLDKLARAVQPLVFETNVEDAPYSTAGTVFLVGFEGMPFILTTRHSLYPENIGPICIFPSDTSRKILPLRDVFFVSRCNEAEDFMDLAVIAIDTERIKDNELAQATLIDLALATSDWESDSKNTEFIVLGFPADHSFLDYEREILHTERICLNARYIGPSSMPYLHELEIIDTHSLTTFSGFSGSPVFGMVREPNKLPRITLCGMVIRGSSLSGRMHFLDSSVLIDALNAKRDSTNSARIS